MLGKKGGKRRRVTQCLMNTAESPAGDGRQADGRPISFFPSSSIAHSTTKTFKFLSPSRTKLQSKVEQTHGQIFG
jgi:hypothetical protein